MLPLTIPAEESWDAKKREFVITRKEMTLQLEHSLVSISKWESKWCKPFLAKTDKTDEELLDYIKCMTITQNVPDDVYLYIARSKSLVDKVNAYINAPMTATTFSKDDSSKKKSEVITSEIIYYWMFSYGIPLEWEKRHLNRLITLVRVFSVKNSSPKKRNQKDIMSRNAALNAARKRQFNTRG